MQKHKGKSAVDRVWESIVTLLPFLLLSHEVLTFMLHNDSVFFFGKNCFKENPMTKTRFYS